MAYFNDANNSSFYSSVSGALYSYPSPNQVFAIDTEGANNQIFADPTDRWSMGRRSGPMVGPPTSLRATANSGERHSDPSIDSCLTCEPPGSVAPTTSYTSRTDGYGWPSYDRSADYREAQSHYSGYLSQGGPFASTTASETSTAAHTIRSGEYSLEGFGAHRPQTVPLDYWGTNQGGISVGAPYVVGVDSNHPCATLLTLFHRGTWIPPAGRGPVQLGPR